MLDTFDAMIASVREQADEFRVLQVPDRLPVALGEHANRRVILRKDTAVELGGSGAPSCAATLATSTDGLVRDGRISLLGNDLNALDSASGVPFAQIVLVAGGGLEPSDVESLEACHQVKDYVEGYQVRSLPGQVWARVSKGALDAGLSAAVLGEALMRQVREACPRVQAVEVVFVTDHGQQVQELWQIALEARSLSRDMRREAWLERGVDIDCPWGGHCGNCGLKDTCTEVRKIQQMRRRKEEDHV